MISWGGTVNAQTAPSTPADQQQPQAQQRSPETPPAQQPSSPSPSGQAPEQSSPTSAAKDSTSDSQVFSGMVEKAGDKYVLKDDAGKIYDIDHQTDVAKFEGKRVRVQGRLDDTGKKILVK